MPVMVVLMVILAEESLGGEGVGVRLQARAESRREMPRMVW